MELPDLDDPRHRPLFERLHELARQCFARESREITIQPTVLVHEAYLRLAEADRAAWASEGQLLASAAHVMRGILIDHARRRNAAKRGGAAVRLTLDAAQEQANVTSDAVDALALEDALTRLEGESRRAASVVELRFFGGLTVEQVAKVLDVSERTVNLEWRFARAWLHRELRP